MSTISLLTLILMVLMILVGGKSGFTSFLSVVFNFLILFAAVILITGGISAIGVTFFAGVCILAITIFMGNKNETSTNTAFVATLIVMVIMLLLIVPLDYFAQIKGFSNEQSEEIEAFNLLVGANFETILISTTVLSTLGAIAEAAVAISSGLEELSEQNPGITIAEIFKSGRTIGFQIMGMTFNTLFFWNVWRRFGIVHFALQTECQFWLLFKFEDFRWRMHGGFVLSRCGNFGYLDYDLSDGKKN